MNLEEIKTKLLQEKEEIEIMLEDLEKEEKDYLYEQVKTPDEEADKYEFKQEYHIQIENLKDRLNKINKALERIEKGNYGTCEKCGKRIEDARLKVDPATPLCRNCVLNP